MAATATNDRSIDLVRQFTEDVFNGRGYDHVTDYQADEYVQHGPLTEMELHGSEESMETLRMFHNAFSDLDATLEFAFSDDAGQYVCSKYTYRGTHDGELLGMPATHTECEVEGQVISRIEDGKIVESWNQVDMLGLMQQLGVVPPMNDVAA